MAHWKDLLHRTHLSDEELKQIPARSNENSLAVWQYYSRKFGITPDDVVKGTPYSFDQYVDSKNWEDAYHARITDRNILWKLKGSVVHREPYYAGRQFFNTKNTLLRTFLRLVPVERLFRETARTNTKFNNETTMDVSFLGKGYALLTNTPYPYFGDIALGHECGFLKGVMEAMLAMHTFRTWKLTELICSARLKNIITKAYGFLDWRYDEDDRAVYLNGTRIGAKVHLISKKVNGREILWPEVDRDRTGSNAVLITENYFHDELQIFRKNEIYNAPYCVFEASWEVYSILGRLQSYFDQRGRKAALPVDELERQIEFSNQKLFEVQEALSESERRLKITEIYTRKSLVEMIRVGDDPTRSPAREERMAVMFSDIREFATLSESMSAQEIVFFLNSYFNRMNKSILKNGGEIDKLMGDCIMAGFSRCGDAVNAGVEMKLELAEYNKRRVFLDEPPVHSGVGVTFGDVVVGNIGSGSKLDHTLIGDTVNASARVEALTKHYRLGLLVSEQVMDRFTGSAAARFIDYTTVKGKREPLRIYEIYEYEPDRIREKKLDIQPDLETAFELYVAGRFDEAVRLYTDLIARVGPHTYQEGVCADPALNFFAGRCRALTEQVKTGRFDRGAWDGVHRQDVSTGAYGSGTLQ
ncbi:adenylate/guanylate cyclase domain-containing protein [Planctomycetota bacterium]